MGELYCGSQCVQRSSHPRQIQSLHLCWTGRNLNKSATSITQQLIIFEHNQHSYWYWSHAHIFLSTVPESLIYKMSLGSDKKPTLTRILPRLGKEIGNVESNLSFMIHCVSFPSTLAFWQPADWAPPAQQVKYRFSFCLLLLISLIFLHTFCKDGQCIN